MEERKTVQLKKEEFGIREYIKSSLGKGKVSKVKIEYTPVGEKIIVSTNKPGLVIGKRGENINLMTTDLKNKFKLENPHIEIDEIMKPEFDAQLVADDIAMSLEKMGPLKFKVIGYRALERIMKAGALGAELILSGKLPSSRAKPWRFAQGYLKKAGDSAKVVDKAQARAETKPGTVGVKVSILRPDAILKDKIDVNAELLGKLRMNMIENVSLEVVKPKRKIATLKSVQPQGLREPASRPSSTKSQRDDSKEPKKYLSEEGKKVVEEDKNEI